MKSPRQITRGKHQMAATIIKRKMVGKTIASGMVVIKRDTT